MRDVVIASYVRSAQSRCRPNDPGRDWLFKIRGDDLLAKLLPEAISRAGLDAGDVDDFIVGCAQGVGENFSIGGRVPTLLANLDKRTSCKQVDEQCGSTMAALQIGFMEIAQGFADVVMCGGMEHMGRIPMGGDGKIDLNLRLFSDPSLLHWDFMTAMNMGLTAEKIASMGYQREDMDAWGARSHQLAYKAQQDGFFDGEILPVDVPQADGSVMTVDTDQAIRSDATAEDMAKLRPAFKKDGTIHAGNASPLNAGASALVLMNRETAEARGITPLAKIVSIGCLRPYGHLRRPGWKLQTLTTGRSTRLSPWLHFMPSRNWASILKRSTSRAAVSPSVIRWAPPAADWWEHWHEFLSRKVADTAVPPCAWAVARVWP
jgi:acetyl-CoA C-acetyltransferase